MVFSFFDKNSATRANKSAATHKGADMNSHTASEKQ